MISLVISAWPRHAFFDAGSWAGKQVAKSFVFLKLCGASGNLPEEAADFLGCESVRYTMPG
jgi:hypothetical protein